MRCSIKQKMRNDAHTAVTLSSRRDYIADTAREIWRAHTQAIRPCRILESAERARTIVARGPNPQQLHPNWVFAGITAAAAHGFDHPRFLHRQGLTITLPNHGSYRPHDKLNIIYSPYPRENAVLANGIHVTNPPRTLLDCGRTLEFIYSLPIFDDAAADGIEEKQILQECARTTLDCSRIFKLLRYTDAGSENGGESFARAVMIENGFAVPQLQVSFADSLTGKQFRVDFLWRTTDGRIIVGELDGTAKYVDPKMTDRRSIQETVQAEREREQALFRAGVTEIVRLTFDDAVQQKPLIAKLRRAGVPCVS